MSNDDDAVDLEAGHGRAPLRRNPDRRVLPMMPESLGDAELRLVRPDPVLAVSMSYADQEYRVMDDDWADYLLQPVLQKPPGRECDPVMDLPVHLISGWHSRGRASNYGQCQEGHDGLQNSLLGVAAYPIR